MAPVSGLLIRDTNFQTLFATRCMSPDGLESVLPVLAMKLRLPGTVHRLPAKALRSLTMIQVKAES